MSQNKVLKEAEFRKLYKDNHTHKVEVFTGETMAETSIVLVEDLKIGDKTLRQCIDGINEKYDTLEEANKELHVTIDKLVKIIEDLLGVKL